MFLYSTNTNTKKIPKKTFLISNTETLRKYAVLPVLNRQCVKDYRIPGTRNIIEKGTDIIIPVLSLQMDEKYYPNPTLFNPDRFKESVSLASKHKTYRPYLAFGEGE